jgi:hypothetical protein
MKNVIIATLVAFVMSFCSAQTNTSNECVSLATVTNEQVSLWDALATHLGVNPTKWTTSAFRAAATQYAQSVCLTYDKSGKGNVAIVHALLCTRPTETLTLNGGRIDRYADDYEDYTVFYNCIETTNGRVTLSQDTLWHKARTYANGVEQYMQLDSVVVEQQEVETASVDTFTFINTGDTTHHVVMIGDSVVGAWTSAPIGVQGLSDTVRLEPIVAVIDTVHSVVVDTVTEEWCNCSHERTLADLWNDYMVVLPKAIRNEKDKGQRALLSACREKIGYIVRTEHRHGGRLVEDDVNVRDQEGATTEPGMRIAKVKLQAKPVAKSAKSNDLARARWNRFVHNWKKFWRSFGACKRAAKK